MGFAKFDPIKVISSNRIWLWKWCNKWNNPLIKKTITDIVNKSLGKFLHLYVQKECKWNNKGRLL